MQLVHYVLPERALGSTLDGFHQKLLWVILGLGVIGEAFGVLGLNNEVEVLEGREVGLGELLEFLSPDDADAHVLASVGHNGTREVVGVDSHQAVLVLAEVSEELGIFPEMRGQLGSGSGYLLGLGG